MSATTATTTVTTATATATPTPTTVTTTERKHYDEAEHEVLEAWRATRERVAADMNAVDQAGQALQARLELPKKHRAYLAIKDSRREALRARSQAFKERVRAAGLKTTFISLFEGAG